MDSLLSIDQVIRSVLQEAESLLTFLSDCWEQDSVEMLHSHTRKGFQPVCEANGENRLRSVAGDIHVDVPGAGVMHPRITVTVRHCPISSHPFPAL
jgi:hypothetical protein